MTFIKVPTHEFWSQNPAPVCIFSGSREDVELRWIRIGERRRWIVFVSSAPLLVFALLQCIATVQSDTLGRYVVLLPIGLTQTMDLFVRRLCLKTLCVSVPMSRRLYSRYKTNRLIIGCIKITLAGGCPLLAMVIGGPDAPVACKAIAILALALWMMEERVRARGVSVHRQQADAITLRIPSRLPSDFYPGTGAWSGQSMPLFATPPFGWERAHPSIVPALKRM